MISAAEKKEGIVDFSTCIPVCLWARLFDENFPEEAVPLCDSDVQAKFGDYINSIDEYNYLKGVYIYSVIFLCKKRNEEKLTSTYSFFQDEITGVMLKKGIEDVSNDVFNQLTDELQRCGLIYRDQDTVSITTYLPMRLKMVYGTTWIELPKCLEEDDDTTGIEL